MSYYKPLALRLSHHYQVEPSDIEQLDELEHTEVKVGARQVVFERGDEKRHLMVILSGWAIRTRHTPDGGRQIVHILLPGDIVTPTVFVTQNADHEVSTLTDTVVRLFDANKVWDLMLKAPSLAAGLWWSTAQEEGMLREQIVRLGRRSALQRIPHLFLELHRRLQLIEQAGESTLLLPLTQTDIGDTLGLSSVHVNRTLRQLQNQGLLSYSGSAVEIEDRAALAKACDFDTLHLHLSSSDGRLRKD